VESEITKSFSVWWISSLVVFLGVYFGADFADYSVNPENTNSTAAISHLTRWEGMSYVAISAHGYRDQPRMQIAFFPAFPLLGRALSALTGLGTAVSLVVLSNLFFFGAIAQAQRFGDSSLGPGAQTSLLFAMAFWPPAFFSRMAYTESMFLFLTVLFLSGIRKGWHPLLLAFVVAIATATRSVGVAMILPLALYITKRDKGWTLVTMLATLIPVGLLGVVAFSLYQFYVFHDAFAFIKIQSSFRMRPQLSLTETMTKLFEFEPIWNAYLPRSDAFWGTMRGMLSEPDAAFNLRFWNPIYFVSAVGLLAIGSAKRWLNRYEVLLGSGLLLIPYVTRGYDFGMCSQARFTTVCFPIYLVLARLIASLPETWRCLVVVLASFQMAMFAALFSANYPLF
jgi:hypothetical protein